MLRCFLFLLLLIPSAIAAAPLDSRIENLIDSGSASFAVWGVYAEEADSGRVLADINGGRLFVPASNRKLVTTALAARRFEPGEQLRTELRAGQMSAAGLVDGDIVLHATGDPSWMPGLLGGRPGQSKLIALAKQAAASGLRRATGSLVIDTRRFRERSPLPPAWAWDELGSSYAGRPAILSLNANLAGITIEPSRVDQPLNASNHGAVPAFEFINQSITLSGGSAPTFRLERSLEGRTLTLLGGLPADAGQSVRSIPLGDPAQYNAQLFLNALREEGVAVEGGVRFEETNGKGDVLLGITAGAAMADMLARCNEESDNFLAESLYLVCAADRYGSGSYDAAHQLENEFWKGLDIDTRLVEPSDGSGLSRENLIAPRAFVRLLGEMRETGWYVESFPVSGQSGTLRYRLSRDGMAGRVRAKTGTLDGVSCLTGYVTANSGRTVIFSIMANNYTSSASGIRNTIDDIVAILAGS